MRAVLQRVKCASVEVDGQLVSRTGPGLLCLIGIRETDTETDADYIARKLLSARLWTEPETGRSWQQSVVHRGYEVLCVSQFTLYGSLAKPRPDFHVAMPPGKAREFYEQFLERLKGSYVAERVKDGVFGAMMDVSLVNDGPVTLQLDSQARNGNNTS